MDEVNEWELNVGWVVEKQIRTLMLSCFIRWGVVLNLKLGRPITCIGTTLFKLNDSPTFYLNLCAHIHKLLPRS